MLRSSIIIPQNDMVSAVTTRIKKKLAAGVAAVCPAVERKPVIERKKRDHAAHRLTHYALPSTRRERQIPEPRSDENGHGKLSGPLRGKIPARALNGRKALPDRITAHPGEVLREEFLKPLGLSVNGLAAGLRVPATRIGAIINGERSVTPDTALRLGRFFCNSPEFWINLQAMHDLTRARAEFGHAIDRDILPLAQ